MVFKAVDTVTGAPCALNVPINGDRHTQEAACNEAAMFQLLSALLPPGQETIPQYCGCINDIIVMEYLPWTLDDLCHAVGAAAVLSPTVRLQLSHRVARGWLY
jgi:hypothetical protein